MDHGYTWKIENGINCWYGNPDGYPKCLPNGYLNEYSGMVIHRGLKMDSIAGMDIHMGIHTVHRWISKWILMHGYSWKIENGIHSWCGHSYGYP